MALAVLALGRRASAQAALVPPHYFEYRADAIVTRGLSTQVGLGVVIPAGIYMRVSVDGAAGPTWTRGTTEASGRVDAIGRFLLDPFRETPLSVSLGGGVSVPYTSGDAHLRPYLVAVVDVEGRKRGPLTPAVQLGLGGGARIGVVLRGSPQRWR